LEHLDLEEGEVLPLIQEHLTVAEWKLPQAAAMKNLPSDFRSLMLLAGVVLEDATQVEHDWFLLEMPPPARPIWRLIGRRMLRQAHPRGARAVCRRRGPVQVLTHPDSAPESFVQSSRRAVTAVLGASGASRTNPDFCLLRRDMTFDKSAVTFGHVAPVQVYFDDLDALGMLHHARFATLLDRGIDAYWRSKGYAVSASADAGDALNVVRALTLTYHRPVTEVREIFLWLWVCHLGTTSVQYGFRFVDGDGTTVFAEGTRTNVRIDPATMRPAPWSDAARADARELLGAEGSEAPELIRR
jgi:acyl-CoA thioester hydrolase